MTQRIAKHRYKPTLEVLEDRTAPALLASEFNLNPPLLDEAEVRLLLERASVATVSNDAIVAVVDRAGNILGVLVEDGVDPAIRGDQEKLIFAVDGAVAKARTAAFFANNTAPLTSRTIQFISQTTIIEREVKSNPNIQDQNSTERGPGFVAPIGVKGHFPPNVAFAPQVDLFAIEHTNRDSILHPGRDHVKGTADDVPLPARFNIDPAFIPEGKELNPPLSYGETILTDAQRRDPAFNHYQSRGIATLPGGIPLYKDRTLVGGIGVFFPGDTGFATEENSSLGVTYDPTRPDRTLEAEFMALAAAGGSSEAGFPVGALGPVPALPRFDVPDGRIDLVGITLDVIGPGGDKGPKNLVEYAVANFQIGGGNPGAFDFLPVDAGGDQFNPGEAVPDGYLVLPHDGQGITAAEVRRIIEQGIKEANRVRAQIRLPRGETTRMVFAVTDTAGEVLGLYRMPDSTVFSIDVAVAKARNTAYYNDPNELKEIDRIEGVPAGVAFTNRTFRYAAHPRFPISVDGTPPGPFSILLDPGVNPRNGLTVGAPQPASAFQTPLGYDAFNPGSNFHDDDNVANQNGVVFFPGSSGVYQGSLLIGGFGVSGDGVDQDDTVTAFGVEGFHAPAFLRADQYFVRGVRLPYFKFPRNPERK